MKKSQSERVLDKPENEAFRTYLKKQADVVPLKPIQSILKRVNKAELQQIRDGDLDLCKKLRFFMQYPEPVQDKLLQISRMVRIDAANVRVFNQGDRSEGYYVIIRGTVKIEQKHLRYADRKDMPPVVIRTCYDGDQFGEMSHFTTNVDKLNALIGLGTGVQEQLDMKSKEDSVFERKVTISENMTKDLSTDEVAQLNAQRTSATTMEPCDLLFIDKLQSMYIIGQGMQDEVFKERLNFLWKVDLFKGINRNHLLPLITNLDIRVFRKGEFIQREGDEPEGLMIIKDGCAIVCTDKLSMRRVEPGSFCNTSSLGEKEIQAWQKNPKLLEKYASHRVYQNKQMYLDEETNIVPKDFVIYQDLMVFKNLFKGSYFGGRCLIAQTNMKNVKKQIKRENNLFSSSQTNQMLSQKLAERKVLSGRPSDLAKREDSQPRIETVNSRQQIAIREQGTGSSLQSRAHSRATSPEMKLISSANTQSHATIPKLNLKGVIQEEKKIVRNKSQALLSPRMQELEQAFNQQKNLDMKSMLSVIADSAKVEVWNINQDLLELLPIHVQRDIITRLQAYQKVKIMKPDKRQKPREFTLERVEEQRRVASEKNILSNFKMPNTARFVHMNAEKINSDRKMTLRTPKEHHNFTGKHNLRKSQFSKASSKRSLLKSAHESQEFNVVEKKPSFLKKLEKVVKRDYMQFKPEPTPNSLIHVNIPMKLRKVQANSIKFDCPDPNCTVCRAHFNGFVDQHNAEGAPEDYLLDRVELQKQHRQDLNKQRRRKMLSQTQEVVLPEPEAPLKEEYGEADRPLPSSVIKDIKEKFVDWDNYKLTVIKNSIDQKRRMRYMRIQ